MFKERQNRKFDSRVRFKIQDLIDNYDKEWKHEIYFCRRNTSDSAGFEKKYVPKGSRLAIEAALMQAQAGIGRRSRKHSNISCVSDQQDLSSKNKPTAWASPAQAVSPTRQQKSMYHLLQQLAPSNEERKEAEDSHSDDEDAMKIVSRKESMNLHNVVGLNFEKYNQIKPSNHIKLKIANLFMEFKESQDKQHASEEFLAICQETETKEFMVAGHILNNAFSQDEANWRIISSLVIDHFYSEKGLFAGKDLVECLNVSMTNFLDTMIDYPNAKQYAFGLFEKLKQLGLLT